MLNKHKIILALIGVNVVVFAVFALRSPQSDFSNLPALELVTERPSIAVEEDGASSEAQRVAAGQVSSNTNVEADNASVGDPVGAEVVTQESPTPYQEIVVEPKFVSECRLIGPVVDENLMAAIQESVETISINAVTSGKYWVYLGPYETVRDARTAWAEISAQLTIDGAVMARGPLAKHISLGLLASEARAEIMRAEREGQGLDAKIKRLGKSEPVTWFKWQTSATGRTVAEMAEVLRQNGFAKVRLKACP